MEQTTNTALFAAGAIPEFLAGLSLLIPAIWIARKNGYGSRAENDNAEQNESIAEIFMEAFWGFLAPVIILGGLYGGVGGMLIALLVVVAMPALSLWVPEFFGLA